MTKNLSQSKIGKPTVLVTGGASGIGKDVVIDLCQAGWNVETCTRASADALQKTIDELRSKGGTVSGCLVDLTDPSAARQWVADCHTKHGAVDALIHCVGPFHRVPLEQATDEDWRTMFESNLHTTFSLTQAVSPIMKAQGQGRIITFGLATPNPSFAHENITAYAIAKAGVAALTKTLARSLAHAGVTANCIHPGFIDTGSEDSKRFAHMADAIPAGRLGTTQDILPVIRFLLSEESAYLTGADIPISGGWGM